MANKCNQCGKFVSITDGAKCFKCTYMYHRSCANLSPENKISNKWQSGLQNIGEQINQLPLILPRMMYLKMQEDESNIGSLSQKTRLLRVELGSVGKMMSSFKQELSQLNIIVGRLTKKFENIEERFNTLETASRERTSEQGNNQIIDLVTNLRSEISDRDQEGLLNDIEVTGLQEQIAENPIQTVLLVARKLGHELEERDIVSAEGVGPRRFNTASAEVPRPRSIVLRLARRSVHDGILRAARVRRGTDSAGITVGESKRIYINEHLTPTNKKLFYNTREEGRRSDWKYVWTKNGRIYVRVRKDDVTEIHRIRSLPDLGKVFGTKII